MITQEHLEHWLSELEYSLTSIRNEINKKAFVKTIGVTINDDYLSLEYLREKELILSGTIRCIKDDIRLDEVNKN